MLKEISAELYEQSEATEVAIRLILQPLSVVYGRVMKVCV